MAHPPVVLCFGEALWDAFPDARRPGGAPLNVAWNAAQLGLKPRLLSAVGRDKAGTELLAWMRASGVDTSMVARVDAPTGTVEVHAEPGGGVHYHIAHDTAWDRIEATPAMVQASYEADAVVFGSLAARSPVNQRTLDTLLSLSGALRVMDVNLRPPFADPRVVGHYMTLADVLKVSREELSTITGDPLSARSGEKTLAEAARKLAERTQVSRIAVTLGAQGALWWDHGKTTRVPAPRVRVVDPVGAGDAFTAALVQGLLEGLPPRRLLQRACARGAWVAARPGAQPAETAAPARRATPARGKPASRRAGGN